MTYEARRAIAGELPGNTNTKWSGGRRRAGGRRQHGCTIFLSLLSPTVASMRTRHATTTSAYNHVRLQLYVRLQMQHELGTTLLCTSCVTSSATRQHSHGDASPKGPKRARSTSPNLHACDPQRESTDEQGLPSAAAAAAPVRARAFGLRSPVSGRALWPHHVSSAVHAAIACSCVSTEPCCAATYSK